MSVRWAVLRVGVIGIRLKENQQVVSMLVIGEGDILTVTANGFGKRTLVDDYSRQGRGGQGMIGIQTLLATARLSPPSR